MLHTIHARLCFYAIYFVLLIVPLLITSFEKQINNSDNEKSDLDAPLL